MDFSLYIVISPSVLRVPGALGASQVSGGSQIDMQKIIDVINAGATAIQLREDSAIETSEYAKIARAVHGVTDTHHIPLIIHDRVDIVVSSGAEGVELGKGCLDYQSTRKLMGNEKFVGVAVTTKRQAELAAHAAAAYIVIGPVYKLLPGTVFNYSDSTPLGTVGVRDILTHISKLKVQIPHLVFGGIVPENVQRVIFQSKAPFRSIDGVVLSYDPTEGHENMVTRITEIKNLMKSRPKFLPGSLNFDSDAAVGLNSSKLCEGTRHLDINELLTRVSSVIANVAKNNPTFRCMVSDDNKVFSKEMSVAIGSTPDFSLDLEEMKMPGGDQTPHGCLINVNSLAPASVQNYMAAITSYNLKACPIILEPKADGADYRRTVVAEDLMAIGYITLLKGNTMEIIHLSGMGKDNYNEVNSLKKEFVLMMGRQCKILAARERCIVLATGPMFFLSDGAHTVTVENGSLFLTQIGMEALGPVLAACLAVEVNDPFLATFSGLLLFTIASEQATNGGATKGPGSFLTTFVDEIWRISRMSMEGNNDWTKRAIVEQIKE